MSSQLDASEDFWSRSPSGLALLLGENGVIITRKAGPLQERLTVAGFEQVEMPKNFMLVKRISPRNPPAVATPVAIVVIDPDPSSLPPFLFLVARSSQLEHGLDADSVDYLEIGPKPV